MRTAPVGRLMSSNRLMENLECILFGDGRPIVPQGETFESQRSRPRSWAWEIIPSHFLSVDESSQQVNLELKNLLTAPVVFHQVNIED